MGKAGRPPTYRSAAQMQEAIDVYFASLGDSVPTVAGMAYSLGFAHRSALDYYKREKPSFRRVVLRSKLRIETALEQQLMRGNSVAGVIFNLKNNFGWRDVQDINSNVTLPQEIRFVGVEGYTDSGTDSTVGE